MKRAIVMMAAVLGVSLMGCGGADVGAEPAEVQEDVLLVSDVSQELTTCTATCFDGQSVSCSGATCSAANQSGVTCDGVFTACPPAACPGTYPACADLEGMLCNRTGNCCEGTVKAICPCFNKRYRC
ncbi:hypothetical protein ACN469_35750 [Corallococcus terminator]